MKKRACLFVGLAVVLLAVGYWWLRSDARYISRVSGVAIPAAAWPMNSYHLDWCVVAKYRISKAAAKSIATRHSFTPFAKLDQERPMALDHLASQFEDTPSAFSKKSGILALRGRTNTNRWEFALEPATGLLWAVMMFPDMAGDVP